MVVKKKSLKESLFLILFFLWIIISIIIMVFFSQKGYDISVAVFCGQYFFIFAMFLLSEKDSGLMPFLPLTIGLIVIVAPFIFVSAPKFTDLSKKGLITIVISIISIILGYMVLIVSRTKKKVNYPVMYMVSWIFYIIGIANIIRICLPIEPML